MNKEKAAEVSAEVFGSELAVNMSEFKLLAWARTTEIELVGSGWVLPHFPDVIELSGCTFAWDQHASEGEFVRGKGYLTTARYFACEPGEPGG